jgi:protein-disulfide isomerase
LSVVSSDPTRRRRTQVLAIAGLAAVVVVAIVLASTLGGDDDNSSAAGGSEEVARMLDGVQQDGTVLGDPGAAYTLTEFADLQCPFCAEFSNDVLPTIVDRLVRPGDLRIDLQLLTFLGPDSEEGARMALALADQDLLWNFVDLFYANQGAENSGYVDEAFLRDLVEQIPGADYERAAAEQGSDAVTAAIADTAAGAQEQGIASTPSFLIGAAGSEPEALEVESLDPEAFVASLERYISANP